jgi:hypothetical protein
LRGTPSCTRNSGIPEGRRTAGGARSPSHLASCPRSPVSDAFCTLTVGGTTANLGNLLTASKGNGLWATGNLTGSGVYRNNIAGSQYGVALVNARSLLVGAATNPALGNTIQYNRIGLFAAGNCAGSSVCSTIWYGNVRKVSNSAKGLLVFPRV